MQLIIYFDYTCPYSYNAAIWLREVAAGEPALMAEWRPFVLKEVNRAPGEGQPFWEQAGVARTRTGLAFIAGQAAARQGAAAYEPFRFALQAAFHVQHQDIRRPDVLRMIASGAGLDVQRFDADLREPGLLQEVGRSHQQAVERYAVFGTPTLVFPNGCAVYVKLAAPLTGAEAPRVFTVLRELVEQHPAVQEIKLTRQEEL